MAITILEKCRIAPLPASPLRQSLPLVHFDMIQLLFPHLQNLLFYGFPCSKSLYLEVIVPILKNSLSLTLNYFLPMAGNILFPLTRSGTLVCEYEDGDAVSMTIAEYPDGDFNHLTGNHPREADEFHKFSAELPEAIYSSDFIRIPVAAAQATLFPGQGICIGFTNHHGIADGATLMWFLQAWGYAIKIQLDAQLLTLPERCLPFYDRNSVEGRNVLDSKCWNVLKPLKPTVSSTIVVPTNKVRATFVLSEADILKLKNLVLEKRPGIPHVSSFTVVCVHLWACLAKAAAAIGEEVVDDEPEYFIIGADCRARLNPPLPAAYFGNCVATTLSESTHGILKGNDGFLDAAQAIGEGMHKTVHNDKGILNGCDVTFQERTKLDGKARVVTAVGSPRFDVHGSDDMFLQLRKYEAVHTDYDGLVSVAKSKESNGVEIGLSLPKLKMDAFADLFSQPFTPLHRKLLNIINDQLRKNKNEP